MNSHRLFCPFRTLEDRFKSLETEFLSNQQELRTVMKQLEGKNQRSSSTASERLSSDTIAASPQPSTSSASLKREAEPSKEDSPYLRLAASSVGLTPLMRTGKVQVLEERPKIMENLQKLSIFATKPRARVVNPMLRFGSSSSSSSAMLEKENVQEQGTSSSSSTGVCRPDRFKIENRLKSGAIKRPTPYNPK